MISYKTYIFITGYCFIAASIFFGIQKSIFIVMPYKSSGANVKTTTTKKNIVLYYWQNTWKKETIESIWASEKNQALIYLINHWLTFMFDEKLMEKNINVQSILVGSNDQELFISFDTSPFTHNQNTHDSLMWIESLLKTIRENVAGFHSIRLLVQHKPMTSATLDFSNSWPINGFLS